MDSQDNQEKEYVLYQEAYDSILYEMCGTGYQSNALRALNACERYDDLGPVVHAHWENLYDLYDSSLKPVGRICSRCSATIDLNTAKTCSNRFCNNCGAIMDEVVVE